MMNKPGDCQTPARTTDADDRESRSTEKTFNGDRWREENRSAIDSSNAWVDEHGLPLEISRKF